MKLLLIRHGQSEADVLNVHEGRADYPLTELGRTQGKAMAAKVESFFEPDIIWSSTLKRAAETTDILTKKVECEDVRFVDELTEQHNGILAGMPLEEAEKIQFPQFLHELWREGKHSLNSG
ncbi:Phosphoglycerate mutase (fragment) [Bacillus sp. 349Y]